MGSQLEKFSAMLISTKPVYTEKKFLFMRDQVGWDATFRYYPQGPRLTFRIGKENPLAGGLQPTKIYHFESIADPKSAEKSEIVTELRTSKPYEMKD